MESRKNQVKSESSLRILISKFLLQERSLTKARFSLLHTHTHTHIHMISIDGGLNITLIELTSMPRKGILSVLHA